MKPYVEDGRWRYSASISRARNIRSPSRNTLTRPGLKDFADIAKFSDKLDGKIYGIEAGNDGNRLIQGMIATDKFGLKGFELVESSEAGMMSQVEKARATTRTSSSSAGSRIR